MWGLGEGKLIEKAAWDACRMKGVRMTDFRGEKCWIGIDCATRNDMICVVIEFEFDGMVFFFAKHYVPTAGPWREDEEIRDLYESWHEQGWLTFTPGSHHTYNELFTDVVALGTEYKIEVIVVDDREANALMAAFDKEGLPVAPCRKNAPNYSAPTKDITSRAVGRNKGLAHDGNPVLAWNVENTIGGSNTAELILPKKVTDHSNMKIDGFDGMCMAHVAYLGQLDLTKVTPPQPMAERGMRVL